MLLTAVNAAVRMPTTTAVSPWSRHTPTTAIAAIARLLMTTASSPYRARSFSRSMSRLPPVSPRLMSPPVPAHHARPART